MPPFLLPSYLTSYLTWLKIEVAQKRLSRTAPLSVHSNRKTSQLPVVLMWADFWPEHPAHPPQAAMSVSHREGGARSCDLVSQR